MILGRLFFVETTIFINRNISILKSKVTKSKVTKSKFTQYNLRLFTDTNSVICKNIVGAGAHDSPL